MAYWRPDSAYTWWVLIGNRVSSGAEVWARLLTFIRRNAVNVIRNILAVLGPRENSGTPRHSVLEASYAVVAADRPTWVSSGKTRREG